MKPLWRDVIGALQGYFESPLAMEGVDIFEPAGYRPWAEFSAESLRESNRDGVLLAVIDYILTTPEFPFREFMGYERGYFTEEQLREILRIARDVAFPDAPPVPVPEVAALDPSGLLDKTPSVEVYPPIIRC